MVCLQARLAGCGLGYLETIKDRDSVFGLGLAGFSVLWFFCRASSLVRMSLVRIESPVKSLPLLG